MEVDEKMVQALVTTEQQDTAGASQENNPSFAEEPSLVSDTGIPREKSTVQPMRSPQVAPLPVTNAPHQGKPRRVRPAVEAARGAQNKTSSTTQNGSNVSSSSPHILNTKSINSSDSTNLKSSTTTSKRKSAYRTDPSPDTTSTEPTLSSTVIHNDGTSTISDKSQSLPQDRLESSNNATGEEETEPPQVTEQELIDDFEAKNFAALQSLRNMKLRKVR